MINKIFGNKIYKIYGSAFLSGASLTLSFAPFSFWPISYLAIVILIYLYAKVIDLHDLHKDPNKANLACFWLGISWGLGFFTTQVSWVFVSIYKYGGVNWLIASSLTGLLIGYLALFPAVNLSLLSYLQFYNIKSWSFSLAFAASWTLIEILRGWLFTGFPWGLLGYSQLNTTIKYYASWIGIYGSSFVVGLISCWLLQSLWQKYFELIQSSKFIFIIKKLCNLKLLLSIGLFIGGFGIKFINNYQYDLAMANFLNSNAKTDLPKKVAIIQSNLAPDQKFLAQAPEYLIDQIIANYWLPTLKLVKQHDLDLVMWPENSLPLEPTIPVVKEFLQDLDLLAKKYKFGLLLGLPLPARQVDQFYNAVLGLGTAQGVYHKINLVPFGDYVPFAQQLRGLIKFFDLPLSSFVAGFSKQEPIILNKQKLIAAVCYDIVYAEQLRRRVKSAEPNIIVVVSEDGWFGDSLGPYQHLDLVRMRAIETGRTILRATTSGISAVIDRNGKLIAKAPMFKTAALVANYEDYAYATIWNKIGNFTVIGFLIIILLVAILINKRFLCRQNMILSK